MKKLVKTFEFAALAIVAGASAAFAAGEGGNQAICDLVQELGGIFEMLRTLAFVGAAFTIAGWAWGYIKDGKGVDLEDVRKKGTGMLVGFILLFSIGLVIQFLLSAAGQDGSFGCVAAFKENW